MRPSAASLRATAIVPIRTEPTVKRRLAHILDTAERRELVRTMFDHVTAVLQDCGLRVIALSPRPLGAGVDIETWTESGHGLNAAIDDATLRTGAPVLIVHADLPLVIPDDIGAVLAAPGDVVIARARDGGTNALLMRTRIRSAFGTSSALAHAARARAAGLRAHVLDRPGLALDIDDEASLIASGWRPSARTFRRPSV